MRSIRTSGQCRGKKWEVVPTNRWEVGLKNEVGAIGGKWLVDVIWKIGPINKSEIGG